MLPLDDEQNERQSESERCRHQKRCRKEKTQTKSTVEYFNIVYDIHTETHSIDTTMKQHFSSTRESTCTLT